MVAVRVFSKSSGKPVKGIKVKMEKAGFLTGGSVPSQYTNDRGEAHFNTESGKGTVYIDGRSVYEGHLSGMVTVYC